MTTIFRSYLPRIYSNENLSNKINRSDDENSIECLSIISNEDLTTTTTTAQFNASSKSKQISRTTNRKRGPRYSRINEKSQPLLKRLIGTIFGDYGLTTTDTHKKPLLPSKSTIKKQFEENEHILHSFLTHIESNIKLTSTIENKQIKMIDNQQQTQIYPTKITIGTSTQYHQPSWLDLMCEDQTTINAWTRIRRRLNPNQQKDILR